MEENSYNFGLFGQIHPKHSQLQGLAVLIRNLVTLKRVSTHSLRTTELGAWEMCLPEYNLKFNSNFIFCLSGVGEKKNFRSRFSS